MNNCTVSGYVTKDPVLETVNVGNLPTTVLHFSVKDTTYTGGKVTVETENGPIEVPKKVVKYWAVSAWRGAAETLARLIKKDTFIVIGGSVSIENYVNKKNEFRSCLAIKPVAFEVAEQRIANETTDDDPFIAPEE